MQVGTRGLSGSDWTKLKRIQSGKPSTINTIGATVPVGAPPSNSSTTKALVLACIDPRFISALEAYLVEELVSPGYTYDLFILAGASLGGNINNGGTTCAIASVNWQEVLNEHINVAIALHSITEVWIFDHLGCGAYNACIASDTVASHNSQFTTLKGYINTNFATLTVLGYYIDLTGIFYNMPAPNAPLGIQEEVPPSSGARILVLGCIDPRFSALLSSFLVNYKNVQFIYDLFILAGSSLGANQSYLTYPSVKRTAGVAGAQYPLNLIPQWGVNWGPAFFDHIAIAILLHNISEVWVFDHLDCGAYKRIKFGDAAASDNDIAQHTPELIKLQGYIKQTTPALAYKGFVMDMSGNITKVVDDGAGIQFTQKAFGSSNIRNPASDYTNTVLWRTSDYTTERVVSNTHKITITRICECSPNTLNTKSGNCVKCAKNGK